MKQIIAILTVGLSSIPFAVQAQGASYNQEEINKEISSCGKSLEHERFKFVRQRVPIFGMEVADSPGLDKYTTKADMDGLQGLVRLYLVCMHKLKKASGEVDADNKVKIIAGDHYHWLSGMAALMAGEITYRQFVEIAAIDSEEAERIFLVQSQNTQPSAPSPTVFLSCVMDKTEVGGVEFPSMKKQYQIDTQSGTVWDGKANRSIKISPNEYTFNDEIASVNISRTTGAISGGFLHGMCKVVPPSKPKF